MNRRGFLRAVGAAGLWLMLPAPAAAAATHGTRRRAEKIRQAIRGRHVLRFDYQGYARTVEPHALGTVSGGRLALLAWQIAGGSRSEPPPGWRTFIVGNTGNLRVLRRTFEPRADYRSGCRTLKSIELEVATP